MVGFAAPHLYAASSIWATTSSNSESMILPQEHRLHPSNDETDIVVMRVHSLDKTILVGLPLPTAMLAISDSPLWQMYETAIAVVG